MKYNFEKWEVAKVEPQPYVRFSKVQMYIPMALFNNKNFQATKRHFDLLIDKGNRAFALCFHPEGKYHITVVPAQIGVSQFVKEFNPKLGVKLYLKSEDNKWIGSLDNEFGCEEACGKPYPSCVGCVKLNTKDCPKGEQTDERYSCNKECERCGHVYNVAFNSDGCPVCLKTGRKGKKK